MVVLSRPEVMLKKNCSRYKHFAEWLAKSVEWLGGSDARVLCTLCCCSLVARYVGYRFKIQLFMLLL